MTSMLKDELNSKFSLQCMSKTIPVHVFFCLHYGLWVLASTQTIQSGPQVQKSVIFSHSVISLNQLLQNSINNTANIFWTFRIHVKIFLSQNIMQNVNSVIYRKNLSIKTDRIDNTEKTLLRLLFEEQSD